MKLLPKTVLIVISSFVCLLSSSVGFYYFKAMNDFILIERRIVSGDAKRVIEAIAAEREQMRVTAIDWAQWDDMYNFMHSPNEEFKESWSTYESYKALKITHTMFFNLEKSLVFGVKVDFNEETVQSTENNERVVREIANLDKLFMFAGDVPSSALFSTVDGKTIIAAASPILDSSRSKPTAGYLVILKEIDPAFIEKIASQTQLNLSTVEKADWVIPGSLSSSSTDETNDVSVVAENQDTIYAYLAINDYDGRPIVPLRVKEDRPVYKQGWENLKLFVWFWAIASVTITLLLIFLLNRFILARLKTVCDFLNSVGSNRDFEPRLVNSGNDELGDLSIDINTMLDSLTEANSEVKAAQHTAERATAAKSMFIARVSHELRTPVGGIVGINRIIKKEPSLSRAVRDLVEMGDKTAHGLLSIIDEILDFSKAESGELSFEKISFDTRQAIKETMLTIAGRLESKYLPEDQDRVELICEVSPEVPREIIGDPTKIRQILTNLLGNSVKFTQKGHVALRVNIESSTKGDWVKFEISDTGIGIPKDKLGTVFEPYKQADSSTTRKFQGTGLGLSIVKQFVEGMGGHVSVDSTSGKGSTFSVALPLATSQSPTEAQSQKETKQAKLPKTVTVIGVDSVVRNSLVRCLEQITNAEIAIFSPTERQQTQAIEQAIRNSELLVAIEEAFGSVEINTAIEKRSTLTEGTTTAVIRPSNLELKEQLYSSGLKYVFAMPVLADDLVFAFQNVIPQTELTDSPNDECLKLDRKLNILVVDDVMTNRIILEDMLEDAGHRVVSVSDGTEMVEKLSAMISGKADAEKFDIVLTDISMAIMNGDDATKAVRELEKLNFSKIHVPIIALTAHAFKEEHDKIREAGVDSVLVKPIKPEKVAEEFARLLPKPQ